MNAYGAWQLAAIGAASAITLAALAAGRLLGFRSLLAVALAAVGGFVGARLMKVVFHLSEAREDPSLIWSLDLRGLDMVGVVLGGLLVGIGVGRLMRLPIGQLAVAAVPGIAVGMSLSKVGCWVAGCCFGRVYDGVGAVTVDRYSDAHLAQIGAGLASPFGEPRSVLPVQLIEIAIPLVALVFSFVVLRERTRLPLAFLASYGVLKALATLLRFPDAAGAPPLMHLGLYLAPLGVLLWLEAVGNPVAPEARVLAQDPPCPPR